VCTAVWFLSILFDEKTYIIFLLNFFVLVLIFDNTLPSNMIQIDSHSKCIFDGSLIDYSLNKFRE
jgi:hypothetical protein